MKKVQTVSEIQGIKLTSDLESLEVHKIALQEAYKASLYHTNKVLLGYTDMESMTHIPIINILESDQKRKLICVPRGSFKSSLGVIGYSIWRLMSDPNLRILIDSELYTNSTKFLREIKMQVQSSKFIEIFGDWRGDVWNEGEIILKHRTKHRKEASITCGGVGTTKVGQHYDIIIGDDMNSDSNSATDEGRRKVVNHYKYNLSILEQTGEYVLIGTRYSETDLIGWVIENEIDIKDFRERKDFITKGLIKKDGVYIYE